jgi:hypothetical protein
MKEACTFRVRELGFRRGNGLDPCLSNAHHFAAVDHGVVIVCFVEYHSMGAPAKNQTAPSVDFESCQSPWDVSTYAQNDISGTLPSSIKSSVVDFGYLYAA